MKKFAIVLFLSIVLVAAPVAAVYPDSYLGSELPDGCIDIEAFIPEGDYHDMNPWGMVSPEEIIFWFGEVCVEDGVLTLVFDQLGSRSCSESMYNPNIEVCSSSQWRTNGVYDTHTLPWDNGVYLANIHVWDGHYFYESFTLSADGSMTYVEGVFSFVPPLWFIEDDSFTRMKFSVSKRVVEFPATTVNPSGRVK